MPTLRVNDIIKDKVLVSRESAHLLEDALSAMMADAAADGNSADTTSIAVDFDGVQGIAPSFLDELLSIFESLIQAQADIHQRSLVIANPPTRLSLKFEAIARGHRLPVRALPDGSWLLSDSENDGA